MGDFSYPLEWDENYVSFLSMKRFCKLFKNKNLFNKLLKMVDWRSFKNWGAQERNCGDIALIVTIQFSTGEDLRSVAFLEAKCDFQSRNFESMEMAQLQQLPENLPYAHLLPLKTDLAGCKFTKGSTYRGIIMYKIHS